MGNFISWLCVTGWRGCASPPGHATAPAPYITRPKKPTKYADCKLEFGVLCVDEDYSVVHILFSSHVFRNHLDPYHRVARTPHADNRLFISTYDFSHTFLQVISLIRFFFFSFCEFFCFETTGIPFARASKFFRNEFLECSFLNRYHTTVN